MNEKEYSVSEAVRLIGVESHVLRYWEEELQVEIRRTSQGHRVYSEQNIALFGRVKELKEQGIQLRAIRMLLEGKDIFHPGAGRSSFRLSGGESIEKTGEKGEAEQVGERNAEAAQEQAEAEPELEPEPEYEIIYDEKKETLRRFEAILKRLIEETMEEQNEKLEKAVTDAIREEMSDLYFLYQDALLEAAAEKETERGIRGVLKRYFRKKRI